MSKSDTIPLLPSEWFKKQNLKKERKRKIKQMSEFFYGVFSNTTSYICLVALKYFSIHWT